jgi:hypothetical protein
VAAHLAFDLGNRTDGTLADLVAVYAGAVPENVRQESDLLIVWRSSALPIIAELGEALPALFEAGSDIAIERNMIR